MDIVVTGKTDDAAPLGFYGDCGFYPIDKLYMGIVEHAGKSIEMNFEEHQCTTIKVPRRIGHSISERNNCIIEEKEEEGSL